MRNSATEPGSTPSLFPSLPFRVPVASRWPTASRHSSQRHPPAAGSALLHEPFSPPFPPIPPGKTKRRKRQVRTSAPHLFHSPDPSQFPLALLLDGPVDDATEKAVPTQFLRVRSGCAINTAIISSPEGLVAQVIVRNLDEPVVKGLKARAALHGRALEQELREILTQASRLSPDERLELADRIRAMSRTPKTTDSADLIREDRDSS